jgi:peptide/nickel transport system substrate-binding protein
MLEDPMTISPRRRLAALLAVAAMALIPTAAFADTSSPTAAASAASSAGSTPSSSSSASPSTPARTTFTVGFLQDVDSLNPFVGILASSYEAWGVTYDTLLGYSQKDFSPVPGLASSWTESADHLTWTYKIRSGLKWSDGVPLTAHDAAYTFNRIMNNSFEQNNYGSYVSNITKAVAPDDTTLILTVNKPTPIMLRLAVYILPEHIWSKIDEKSVQTTKNEPIVGSGPFIFEQHVVGQFIRFKANPNYWAGAPKIKELVFRIFQSEDTMVAALKKGEIDFADSLGSTSFDALKSDPNITRVAAEYTGFDELAMNTGAATDTGVPIGDGSVALKDKRVRQAINYAIDTKTLVDKVLGGYGEAGTSIIPSIYADAHYDPGDTTRSFNLDKANQILDDAGYTKGSDGIRTIPGTGKRLTLRLFGRSSSPTSKDSVQYIAGWLGKIGIDVQIQIVSEDNLTQIIGDGDYDMFEWGWVVEPDPNYQLSTFLCSSRSTKSGSTITAGLSDSFYCNPAYDALYNQQGQTTDLAARDVIVKQMEKMLYDDAPYVVTYYYANLEAYRSDRFTNFQPQPIPKGSLLFQYGSYSYRYIEPVVATAATSSSGSTGLIVGIAVAVIVLLGLGGVLLARSRRPADDRE